jgi:type IV pilus assembly protein PilB
MKGEMAERIQTGNLRDTTFAKIFYSIAGGGRTGVLNVVDEKDRVVRKRMYFLGGDTAFVKFGPMEECLGQILIRNKSITEDQLEEAMDEIAVDSKMLGQALVQRKIVAEAQLQEALKLQTQEKLLSCFAWTDGGYEFQEESVSGFSHQVTLFKIRPEQIVVEGVNRHMTLDRIEKEFEHFKDKWLKLSANFSKQRDAFGFAAAELGLALNLSTGRPFAKIIGGSDLGLTRTLKVLYALLVTGMVEITEAVSVARMKRRPDSKLRRDEETFILPEIDPAKVAKELGVEPGEELEAAEAAAATAAAKMQAPATSPAAKAKAQQDAAKQAKANEKALAVRQVSDLLFANRREALAALLPGRGDGGKKMGEILVSKDVVASAQLSAAMSKMREEGGSLLTNLAKVGAINEDVLSEFLSQHFGVPSVNLDELELEQEIVSLIPEELSKKYKAIPINRTGKTLVVAMADPTNIEAIDEIKFLTEYNVEVVVATENQIKNALDKYHDSTAMLDDVMLSFDDSEIDLAESKGDDESLSEMEKAAQEAPVVKLVNNVFVDALNKRASDVHIEPYEMAFRIRYRIDGTLYPIANPPMKLKTAIVARIKVMSRLDISERRMPQDGRISLKIGNKKIDFRISTLPTLWGEKVVCRLLDKTSLKVNMTDLGMEPQQLEALKWGIYKPYGMVLATGPSGCGKTTTLYSSLLELNKVTRNVSTAEDPVEYNLDGINQVQMRDEIGLNFAAALRSFLRQDPNVIMVGEIRDFETAEIAVKAALTGHIVLSTVHTNDAPSTVNRLLNMGVEPFLVTAAITTICSQRLVRRLCPECMEPEETTPEALLELGVPEAELEGFVPYRGRGCPACSERGYMGRGAIFEVLSIRGEIAEMILSGATPIELKREAVRQGMVTLRMAGLHKVRNRETSLEEVTRTTMPD